MKYVKLLLDLSIYSLNMLSFSRDGNLGDISKAGSFHEFLVDLHKEFGPIASFWWGRKYTVSIASAELFEEITLVFDRPCKLTYVHSHAFTVCSSFVRYHWEIMVDFTITNFI